MRGGTPARKQCETMKPEERPPISTHEAQQRSEHIGEIADGLEEQAHHLEAQADRLQERADEQHRRGDSLAAESQAMRREQAHTLKQAEELRVEAGQVGQGESNER